MKKILYLYREIMPYNIPVLQSLVSAGFEVVVVHDTIKRLTPYEPPEIPGIKYYPKEKFNQLQLNELAENLHPMVTFIADRTNVKYNKTAILLRKKYKIPVIVGCDTQWKGGRQWLNVITSFFRHKVYYSHVLVAGMRQFEYAKRLGFENNKVLWPLYSADNRLFNQIPLNKKKFDFPRDILFVGRFAEVKGIETLLKAWVLLLDKKAATLTLVGNGPLKDKLVFPADVRVLDFTTQEELAQLAYKSTCFVLPSVFEPWALVLHEFAATGLPMIATSACGATTQFLINNYNGFVIEPNDVNGLASALQKILQMDAEILYTFSKRSRELSQAISPDLVANAILSVIK